MKTRLTRVAFLAACALAVSAVPAMAANLTVAPRKASFGCAQKEQYNSIQAAVNAAHTGDTITVCPGTYQEQVLVNKQNLTLTSQMPLQATIKAPTSMNAPGAIVQVTAPGVKLTGFTITNSGQTSSPNSIQFGVYISNGGSADVRFNDIADISDAPISGDQNGVAVEVGRASASTTGSVILKNNTIENYQKNGVTVDGPGSSGDIESNAITGVGPTNVIAQNGIQISSGATGTVRSNIVRNNVYSPGNVASTGILLCGQGQTNVTSNTLSTNDVGLFDAANDSAGGCPGGHPKDTLNGNTIIASTFDGLVLDGEIGPQVQNDQAAGTWGHQAYGSDQGDGIDVFNTTGALVQGSTAAGNSEDGFHAEPGTSGNQFKNDQAPANLQFDCQDGTGTTPGTIANTWQADKGDINMPQFLCQGNPNVAATPGASSPNAATLAPSAQTQAATRRVEPSPKA